MTVTGDESYVASYSIWDGQDIASEVSANNTVSRFYVRGYELIQGVDLTNSSNNVFYLQNGHGDVTGLTNASGTVTKSYEYDAFGVEKNKVESDTNPFRYCGEYFDKETDSIYLRARYYNPTTGRFTSEDPVMDGNNWYSYCAGNPVMFVDRNGCQKEPFLLNSKADLINYFDYVKDVIYCGEYDNALKRSQDDPNYKYRNSQMQNALKGMNSVRNNKRKFRDMDVEVVSGVAYDVPILHQTRNACWAYSDVCIYSWQNDLQLGFTDGRALAEENPLVQQGIPSQDCGTKYGGDMDYKSIEEYMKANGPMYVYITSFENGKYSAHSFVLTGCFELSDGQQYAIYNYHNNAQTVVPFNEFIDLLGDYGFLETTSENSNWPWEG